jgi:hypothetical protein
MHAARLIGLFDFLQRKFRSQVGASRSTEIASALPPAIFAAAASLCERARRPQGNGYKEPPEAASGCE